MISFIKDLIPPVIVNSVQYYTGSWKGNYLTWSDAAKKSVGYDEPLILARVRDGLFKVKSGEACFERDSVVFYQEDFNFPLLASLLLIANDEESTLNVVDFGGSLGSTYFQNRHVLANIKNLSWSVVEQGNFATCGRQHFEDDILKFYETVEEGLGLSGGQTLLLSSVMQYISEPAGLIKTLLMNNFKYVIVDRMPFFHEQPNRITVQTVPDAIYKASYPCRIFNKQSFISMFADMYTVVFEFKSLGFCNLGAHFEGFLLKKKE